MARSITLVLLATALVASHNLGSTNALDLLAKAKNAAIDAINSAKNQTKDIATGAVNQTTDAINDVKDSAVNETKVAVDGVIDDAKSTVVNKTKDGIAQAGSMASNAIAGAINGSSAPASDQPPHTNSTGASKHVSTPGANASKTSPAPTPKASGAMQRMSYASIAVVSVVAGAGFSMI